MRYFAAIPVAPLDTIFGLSEEFNRDMREHKVNLSIGIYKDEEGKTPILRAVSRAEELLSAKKPSKVYLPIGGDTHYHELVGTIPFKHFSKHQDRIAVFQTIGGTGALRMGADFLRRQVHLEKAYITDPSWPNHQGVFSQAGFRVEEISYPEHYIEKLHAVYDSVVVHHASCHNPTGAKLQKQEWQELLAIAQKNRQFSFFDAAYLGLGQGLEQDAYPLELWLESGVNFAVALSFSKNLSLYGERAGALFVVCDNPQEKKRVESQIKSIIRTCYSNPPCHPHYLVKTILDNPAWKKLWYEELNQMRARIQHLRHQLAETGFNSIRNGEGMFAFTGLKEAQVLQLREKFGVYMTEDGRVNLAGLNSSNFAYVKKALHAV